MKGRSIGDAIDCFILRFYLINGNDAVDFVSFFFHFNIHPHMKCRPRAHVLYSYYSTLEITKSSATSRQAKVYRLLVIYR